MPSAIAGRAVRVNVAGNQSKSCHFSFFCSSATNPTGKKNTAWSLNENASAAITTAARPRPRASIPTDNTTNTAYKLSHWAQAAPFRMTVGRNSATAYKRGTRQICGGGAVGWALRFLRFFLRVCAISASCSDCCVCVCAFACVGVCMCVCVRACVCGCACVRGGGNLWQIWQGSPAKPNRQYEVSKH